MANYTITVECALTEFCDLFIFLDEPEIPIMMSGHTIQEIADACRDNAYQYLQTYKQLVGEAIVNGKSVKVSNLDFDRSPLYVIDGLIFVAGDIPDEYREEAALARISQHINRRAAWAVRTRNGSWNFFHEREGRPEVVRTTNSV